MGNRLRQLLLFASGFCISLHAAFAQYELDEMTVHAGGGANTVLHISQAGYGPAVNAAFDFTHYPCGKAFAIQGIAGVVLGQTQWAQGDALLGVPNAGKSTLRWAVGEIGASLKVRVHEYHRPREVALVVGPRLWVPIISGIETEQGKGSLDGTQAQMRPFQVGGNFGLQFRRPAPDKKSWFFEPGIFWSPMPFLLGNLESRTTPLYLYLNFGFAFWDERG